MRIFLVFGLCGVAAFTIGCSGSSDTNANANAGDAGPEEASVVDAFVAPAALCATDPRAAAYVPGLEQAGMGGLVKAKILDMKPAAVTTGVNTWTVQLAGVDGAAMDGATITMPKPYMPDHRHYSSGVPQGKAEGADGKYAITNLNFFMPGIWQITLKVTTATGADTVMYTICVPG